jgi:hypothetical protein
MAVKIPTRAIIPKAIIKTVKKVLSRFDRIELSAICKFSKNNPVEIIVFIIHSKIIHPTNKNSVID